MSDLLFSKNDSNVENQEDVWDDTALIRAYNKSINLINRKLNDKTAIENQKTKMEVEKMDDEEEEEFDEDEESDDEQENEQYDSESINLRKRENNVWKIGDVCMAIYKEDGLLYKAEIIKIFDSKCLIKYLYYLNEEEKFLDELYEVNEEEKEQIDQKNQSKSTEIKSISNNKSSYKSLSIPPPPPPPGLFDPNTLGNNKDEELYTMLMSWYMSGYHTGYYFGLKQANISKNIKK